MQQPGVTLAISIHLNSFPQNENVYGAQVFYPKNQEVGTDVLAENSLSRITSKTFAEAVQKSLETNISDGRERAAMAKNDILLFKNSTGNMILAECGFLSNPQEAEKLKTAEYQRSEFKVRKRCGGIACDFGVGVLRGSCGGARTRPR